MLPNLSQTTLKCGPRRLTTCSPEYIQYPCFVGFSTQFFINLFGIVSLFIHLWSGLFTLKLPLSWVFLLSQTSVHDLSSHLKRRIMPFMHGSMPLRRTFFYLQQGKVKFRDNVHVFAMGFHKNPTPEQTGARDFVYWHWAQLQYHNPKVQLVKHADKVITPFARAYLSELFSSY